MAEEDVGPGLTTEADVHPVSAAEALRWVADYLDLSDKLLEALRRSQGETVTEEPSSQVQNDLRHMADALEKNPTLDLLLWEYVIKRRT